MIPDILEGNVIGAGYLNKVRDAAELSQNLQGAGAFRNGAHVLQANPATTQGISALGLRLAVTTMAIPAAVGSWDGHVTPGVAMVDTTSGEEPANSIIVLNFGASLGDTATPGTVGKCENYSPTGPIEIHKGIWVFYRGNNIWAAVSEFCKAYSEPEPSS